MTHQRASCVVATCSTFSRSKKKKKKALMNSNKLEEGSLNLQPQVKKKSLKSKLVVAPWFLADSFSTNSTNHKPNSFQGIQRCSDPYRVQTAIVKAYKACRERDFQCYDPVEMVREQAQFLTTFEMADRSYHLELPCLFVHTSMPVVITYTSAGTSRVKRDYSTTI